MPNNVETLFKVLESDPAYAGVYKSPTELQQILDNPTKAKQFYTVLNSDPTYKGVYNSFEDFSSTYTTPAKPEAPKESFWQKASKFASKWSFVNAIAGTYDYFADPDNAEKAEAYKDASTLSAATEYSTPRERSEDLQTTLSNAFKLLNPGKSEDEIALEKNRAIKNLGYYSIIASDADGTPFLNYEKDNTSVPLDATKAELEKQRSEIESTYDKKKGELTKFFDGLIEQQAIRDQFSGVGGYLKSYMQLFPLGLDLLGKSKTQIELEKQKQTNLENLEKEKNKALAYYAESLGKFRTIVDETTDPNTGYTPFNPLANINPNDPESVTQVLDKATQDLTTLSQSTITNTPAIKSNELLNYAEKGIDLQYFNDNTTSQIKKNLYTQDIFAEGQSLALEQQKDIFIGIQHDRQSLSELVNSYKEEKANLDANIAKTNYLVKKGNVLTPEGKQRLANQSLLSAKLGTYIKSQEKYLDYLTSLQKNNTKEYQDFLAQDKKLQNLAEYSPFATGLAEAARTIIGYPAKPMQLVLNYLRDDPENFHLRHSLSTSDLKVKKLDDPLFGDVITLDEKGDIKWNLDNVNGLSLIYNTTKVAADSYLLGLGMLGSQALFSKVSAGIAGLEGRLLGESAEQAAARAGLDMLGKSSFSVGAKDVLATIAKPLAQPLGQAVLGKYGILQGANWAAETVVGAVVPSVMLFGDDILKQEMEKGLTFEQAKFTSTLLAAIEGLTERINPNEMAFVKRLIGIGEIQTLKDLSENSIYKRAVLDAIEKQTGKTISERFYNALFKPAMFAKEFASIVKAEGDEEVIGLFLQQLVNYKGRQYNPNYQGEELTVANILNTYLSTAATMLPMGISGGRAAIKEYNQSQKQSQFIVGSKPAPYYQATLQLYQDGKISKEEFERRSSHIRNITDLYQQAAFAAVLNPKAVRYTTPQKEAYAYQVFSKLVDAGTLKSKLTEDLTDEEKVQILEDYDRANLEVKTLLEQGLFKSEDERVTNTAESLDYYFNPNRLNMVEDLRYLKSVEKKLASYSSQETNEGLKRAYLAKIGLIQSRIAAIEKMQADANKTTADIAAENNKAKKITIPTPGIEGMSLKYNTPYHLSQIEEDSTTGSKVIKEPVIVINFQNPDGSLNVTSEGETFDMPFEDLTKYQFTSKAEMDKLRSKGDPKAFVFDNKNNVFTYEFGKETKDRDKVVKGRLVYDPATNTVQLRYKNKKGEVASYNIDKSTLNDYKANKGKLKYVKTLETEAEYQQRLAKSLEQAAKTDFEKLQDLSTKRIKFLFDYLEARKKELTASKELISKIETELTNLESKINNLTTQTSKSDVTNNLSALFEEISQLEARKTEIKTHLEELYAKRDDLQNEIDYISSKYKDNTFDTEVSMVDVLVEDLLKLEDQLTAVNGYIKDLETLVKGIEEVISRIVDTINSLLQTVNKIYPGLSFDPFKWIEDIRRDPSLLDIPGYAKDLEEIGTIIENNLDKLDVEEAKVANLQKSIQANKGLAKNIKDRIRYQNNLIEAAEKVKKQFKQEDFMKRLKTIAEEIFKTVSKKLSTNEVNDSEEDSKLVESESSKIELKDIFSSTTGTGDLNNPRVLRFQKLLNSNTLTRDHKLLVVTKNNAGLYGLEGLIFTGKGITNTTNDENDNDIVLVVVKSTNEGVVFVDEFGNAIQGTPTPDNVVSTSVRMARITWESGQINIVDKEEDLKDSALVEKAKPYIEAHKAFRQMLIDTIIQGNEIKLDIVGVSRGFPTTPNNTSQPATVSAGLPETVDLATTQVIQIPKSSDPNSKVGWVQYQGSNTSVKMPKGRPVFSWKNMFFFLNNRRFGSSDIAKYQRVFKYLYDNLNNPVERDKALTFLQKTLYVRDPSQTSVMTEKGQTASIGRAQIWFRRTSDNKIVLHLRDKAIPFNMEDGYVPPYVAIEAFFQGPLGTGIYHNIDAKDLVGKEFVEFYLAEGELKQRVWPSYQQYLLADKYPDSAPRPINEIPLTTTLLPSTETTPNVTGRYLIYKNPQVETVIKQQKPTAKPTEKPIATAKTTGKETTITLASIGPATDEVPGRQYKITRKAVTPQNTEDPDNYTLTFEKKNGKFVHIASTGAASKFPPSDTHRLVNSLIQMALQQGQSVHLTVTQTNTTVASPAVSQSAAPKKQLVKLTDVPSPEDAFPTGEKKEAAPQTTTTTPKTTLVKLSDLQKEAESQNQGRKGDVTKKFRIATQQEIYKKENLAKAKEWWEKRFPQIPFRVVEGLVDGIAYGAVYNHMMTLSQIAEEGTVYHEAFEAVAAYFLEPAQLNALRAEFRSRQGTFIEYGTGKEIKYSEATNDQIREQLAEEYREYELSEGKKLYEASPKKVSLFRQIYNFIHDFLFGRPETIKEVFDNIRSAKYKDKVPQGVQTTETAYRLAMNTDNPTLFREVMNGMSNLLFQTLRGANVNVLDFLASTPKFISSQYDVVKADIDDFYGGAVTRRLFEEVFTSEGEFLDAIKDVEVANQVLRTIAMASHPAFLENFAIKYGSYNPATGKYDIEEFGPQHFKNLYAIFSNYIEIHNNWDEYVEAHKDFLSLYKIEFEEDSSESDEEFNTSEDKNQSEYAKDGLKFSVKQNANTEVKMFLATLLKSEYTPGYLNHKQPLGIKPSDKDTRSYINSMIMSELVDYNKLVAKLLDKLSIATSFNDMVAIMRESAVADPVYASILEGLRVDVAIEDLSPEEASYVMDLQSKFFVSMSNMSPKPITLVLNEDGTTSYFNTSAATSTRVVKDKWLSSLRHRGLTKYVESEDKKKGPIRVIFNPEKIKTKDLAKERDILGFFEELGFDFNIPFSRMTEAEIAQVSNVAKELFKLIRSEEADAILHENKLTKESLTTLAQIYIKYSNAYQEVQRPNIEGQPVQNVIQQNFIGVVTKLFNASKSLFEFTQKIPQLKASARNAYISSSLVLNPNTLFFNSAGERTKTLDLLIIEGTSLRDSTTGIVTSDLAPSDYVAQEFAHNLLGNYYLLVTADSKTEWGIHFGHLVSRLSARDNEHVNAIMRNHLIAEIKAAQLSPNSALAHVKKKGLRLRQFEQILKTVDPDFELVISPQDDAELLVKTYQSKIDEAFTAYFEAKAQKTFKYMKENNLIIEYRGVQKMAGLRSEQAAGEPKYSILKAPAEFIGNGLTEEELIDLIKFREINYTLAMIEQFKIMWGDPAQWKDITKRIKSYVSNRNTSINGMESFNRYWNHVNNTYTYINDAGEVQTVQLKPGDVGYVFYDDTLRVQTFQDVLQVSDHAEVLFQSLLNANAEDLFSKKYNELTAEEKEIILSGYKKKGKVINPYTENNEADGQAWSFPQGYKEIRQRATTWTKAEEEQYQWDMALMRWEVSSGRDYYTKKQLGIKRNLYPEGERGEALKAHDEALLQAGNPYLNRMVANETLPVQQVLKPIYSGYKDGEVLEQDIRKMSIANINWRIAKGTSFEDLYLAHVTAPKPTHFINMESANKIGLLADIEPMYVNNRANTVVRQETLHFKYFGIQVETKGQKDSATLGTQLTKLATLNLMLGGVPLDFIRANPGKSSSEIKKLWRQLSEQTKLQQSKHYKLVRRNTRLLSAMKLKAKEKLFKEFGFEEAVVQGIPVIRFSNLAKFEELIQRELKNRQAPMNIRKAAVLEEIDGELKFSVRLDLQIGSEKLEALITSLLDKRLLHPKMFGGQLPQISTTLLESKAKTRELVYKDATGAYKPVTDLDKLTKEERESVRITSSDLKWYTPEQPWIEVKLPFYMSEFLEAGKELKVSDIKDQELLFGIGFRIPTQELNSVEYIKIVGFLPPEYGNSIVVPSEITTKAGSDFDIDKLNMYLYNYHVVNGQPVKIKYLDESYTAEERYAVAKKQAIRPYAKAVNKVLRQIRLKESEKLKLEKDLELFEELAQNPEMESYNALVSSLFNFGIKSIEDAIAADAKVSDLQFDIEEMHLTFTELVDKLDNATKDFEKEMPFEVFAALPIELQNSKEALDNAYIDNLRELISLPDNFSQLVLPNSVAVLKSHVDTVNRLWKVEGGQKSDASVLDSLDNALTRLSFLVGKAGVGIGAAAQTLHSLAQLLGTELSETTETPGFYFPTNSYISEDGKYRVYSIGERLTQDKKSISSVISAFINAFVDIAKDPWILAINGTKNTASVYIAAIKLGMPVEEVILWFNQPIIRDYVDMVQKSKSVSAAVTNTDFDTSDIIRTLGKKYNFTTTGYSVPSFERPGNFTAAELKGYISTWVELQEQTAQGQKVELPASFIEAQSTLLAQFRKLESISWDLFKLGQALNLDTSRTVTFDSIRLKIVDVVKGLNGPFKDSIVKALNETFIGTIFLGQKELLEGLRSEYLTEHPYSRAILNPLINSIFLGRGKKEVKEQLAQNMRKDFLTYLFHTIPVSFDGEKAVPLNTVIDRLFFSQNSVPDQLLSIQKTIEEYDLEQNFLLNNILGIIPVVSANPKQVKITRRMTDTIDSDHATSDWLNLEKSDLTRTLTTDLIKYSLLQKGLTPGSTSLTGLIPNEKFTSIARQVEAYFNSRDITGLLQNFEDSHYANNWWNSDLIPRYVPKYEVRYTDVGEPYEKSEYIRLTKTPEIPRLVIKWVEPADGISDFKPGKIAKSKYFLSVSLKVEGPPGHETPMYNREQIENMRKRGDDSYMDQILYKRVEIEVDGRKVVPLYQSKTGRYTNHYVVFYPVARMGKRGELIEHYAAPGLSIVNPAFKATASLSGEDVHNLLLKEGRGTTRFLSDVVSLNEENEDISLSLSPDLVSELENKAASASVINVTLFESAKTAAFLGDALRQNPTVSPTDINNLPNNIKPCE